MKMETHEHHNQLLTSTAGRGATSYLDLKEFAHLQQDGFGIVMLLLTINTSLRGNKAGISLPVPSFHLYFSQLPDPLPSLAASQQGSGPSQARFHTTHHVHGSGHGQVEGVKRRLVLNNRLIPAAEEPRSGTKPRPPPPAGALQIRASRRKAASPSKPAAKLWQHEQDSLPKAWEVTAAFQQASRVAYTVWKGLQVQPHCHSRAGGSVPFCLFTSAH